MNKTLPPDQILPAAALAVGVARRDMTPPVGIYARQWGAAEHDVAEGVHRPLCATIMALRGDGDEHPLILASLDAGWWQKLEDERRVRTALLDALGLAPQHVLIALTHTHAACSLCSDDIDQPGGEHIAPYLERITQALIDASREAIGNLAPATLTFSSGRCAMAANRDLADPQADRDLCGFNPAAPADDRVLVGRATDASGRIIGTLVNYACHPTTLAWENRLISPDYIGAMREVVERETNGAPCLFLQGASGDLGVAGEALARAEVADANGRQLGYAVAETLEAMREPNTVLAYVGAVESGAPIATWQRRRYDPPTTVSVRCVDVELPLKSLPTESALRDQLDACTDRVTVERLRRKLRVVRKVGSGPTLRVPTWYWRFGRAVLVAHPNECYSVLQTTLRARFSDFALLVVTVVNGGAGYISPPELHDRDLYQVWQSPFDREALPTLIGACGDTIERMIQGR